MQNLARDVGVVGAREVQNGIGDYFRLREVFGQYLGLQAFEGGGNMCARDLCHVGVDNAWRHRVRDDVSRRELDRYGFGKRLQATFGCGISRLTAVGLVGGHRGDIDDSSVSLAQHVCDDSFRHPDGAQEVRGHRLLEIVRGDVQEQSGSVGARVVHEDIDPAEFCVHGIR
ncbi:Uncharacterised protein [Mycobacteroides abscessus subsp. abscessus]|nr:Uncharacterised protein [Mycobacteroides abscessus subsp. abscessus]